ncbi:hypothetical protein [Parahaliea mediterranea]|uniref:hypothetical protein n=1 Tax=Parahaliea mediterranea TaxID=651086 RepID=UPI001300AD7E|nr:hypothetical protein [Parahaliea mediterranea]
MNEAIRNFLATTPGAKVVKSMNISTSKIDTLDDARRKVIDKIDRNIDYINSPNLGEVEKPDLLYKRNIRTGLYIVGAKYGNRWLDGIDGNEGKFIEGVSEQQLVNALEAVKSLVESKDLDEKISFIQSKNLSSRRKI